MARYASSFRKCMDTPRYRWPITGSGSRQTTTKRSSKIFANWTRRSAARTAEPDWGSPSADASPACSAAASPSRASWARARPSHFCCHWSSTMDQDKHDEETGPLVLVVDDLADNRELYATYLEFIGYRVAMAADG